MSDVELVHEFLDSLAEGRIEDWRALLSDDVVAETPFAPDGTPKRFAGADAVGVRFGDARLRMKSLSFLDRVAYETNGGPVVLICRSEGVRGDDVPYKNSYCWLFTVVDGCITHWVEYFDPQEVLRVRS